MDSYRLFKRGEPWAICAAALATGPQTTEELALLLHPQRVNEPVPDGLGEYGIA